MISGGESGKLVFNLSFAKAGELAARSYDKAAAISVLNCPRYLPLGPIRTSNLPFLVSFLTPKNRGCGVLDLSMPLLDFLDRLVEFLLEALLAAAPLLDDLSDVLVDSFGVFFCVRGLDLALDVRGVRGDRGDRGVDLRCGVEYAFSVARVVRVRRLLVLLGNPDACCFWNSSSICACRL